MKKRTLMLLFCAGSTIAAHAQKNSVLLLGSLGGYATADNEAYSNNTEQSGFSINPGIGYQLSNSWTVGIMGTFIYSTGKISGNGLPEEKSQQLGGGGGLFARYTIPITNLLFFYTQAEGLYSSSDTYGTNINKTTNHSVNVKLSPNIGLKIKNGYALNFGFGNLDYYHSAIPGTGATTSSLSYNLAQGFTFGMSKNFLHRTNAGAIHTAE